MRKFWLLFSQSATIALGFLLVITIFKPEWRIWPSQTNTITDITPSPNLAPNSYRVAASKAIPSVVNIFTSKAVRAPAPPITNNPLYNHFFGGQAKSRTQRVSNLGSGVIVSADGYILTNHHVVESADEIQVALHDGRTLLAKVVGTDPETDLAVLKIDASNLPAITFSQSDQASIGDVVLAIGDPFGVGQTVTMGIISALGRSHLGINTFEDFIQTDAAINPGNSGGPLVDTNGNLIGINSAIYSRTGGSQGIGFAIPSNLVAKVMKQIIDHGEVIRGWMGIEVQDLTPELAESYKLKSGDGALIAGILRGGPADRANIHPGDVLLSVDKQTITDSAALLNQIAALKPGQSTTITLLHRDKILTTVVKIARRPKLDNSTESQP
ncbi:Do family serine endopeptidase [Sulfuriferula thiophila]|uniref:Do family serine endopeptidase n=1 Tax=Sulfuriferula thiophila TaxID=1781211 RepID=UPI000F60F006|nr:Do family serine endopeptidase [Sulfuriferula thiophila]